MGLTRKQCEALGIGDLFPQTSPRKGSGGPAHVRFAMNRTENRFAEGLEGRRLVGEIRGWEFEKDTFLLGPEMEFTPDFRVEELNGQAVFYDVKGKHRWEDATIKIKAAAILYPWHRFAQARWNGIEWKIRWFRS